MSSTPFYDTPGGIRREGNTQTLTFTRTSPTTGTVCWAPVPVNGTSCGTPSGYYAGGVLIGSTKPIGQPEKPVNGTCCYKGDPTLSVQLFAGDTLGGANVLWSSNTDVTTSCVDVTGLDGNCAAYYFAFFAVDNVCSYNQDGIYSYSQSLSTTIVECTNGSQCIQTNGIRPTDNMTLLTPGGDGIDPATKTYPVEMIIDGNRTNLALRGSHLSTYQSLVDELATAWQRIGPPPHQSAFPPHYGEFATINGLWYQFDGETSRQVYPVISPVDPQALELDSTWLNTGNATLNVRTQTDWVTINPIVYPQDPTVVGCGQYWWSGVTGYKFDGVVWLDQSTYVQSVDPTLPPTLTCLTFWKHDQLVKRWNESTSSWTECNVLTLGSDPLSLPNGTFWYNPLSLSVQLWNGLTWITQPFTNSTTQPTGVLANALWFNPSANVLSRFNGLDSTWGTLPVTVAVKPLNSVAVGELWYNTTTNQLSEYSPGGWINLTSSVISSPVDPSHPPVISTDALWKNTAAGLWFVRSGTSWVGVDVIESPSDPITLTIGYWYNTSTTSWYQRSGMRWLLVTPQFTGGYDPTISHLGATWFDGTNLHQHTTLTSWSVVPFSVTPVSISPGSRWLNTTDGALSVWSGTGWVQQQPPYTVAFTATNDILVTSSACGEPSYVEVVNAPIFSNLLRFILAFPVPGLDGKSGTPMYAEVGVGTDGSVDERRSIIDNLYTRLGHPVINVELTRGQMDLAVQKGLDYIRRDSGAGYTRGYFFLTLNPGQQHYTLTSKAVGFNKIVDVLYLYRPRGGFLNSTFGGEIYGQQMLQQLYVSGTFDILTYHLLASYQSVVAKMFASELQFQWSERTRVLAIQRKIARQERILVDAVLERTEQDLFTDRITKNWVENWALTEAKIMLGEMRGKYSTLPGAGGSISLNADGLKAEAVAMQSILKQEIDDFVANDVETWGIGASITRG